MSAFILEWLNLLLRWLHIIAGIAWIGSSFFFMWLDRSLERFVNDEHRDGELWMVHSGGFYQVVKYKPKPGELPKTLHWFKWEAGFTWITGILLLSVVYYFSHGSYLIDTSISQLTSGEAIALCIVVLIVSWPLYDIICLKAGKHQSAILLVLLAVAIYGLTHILSGRGAFMHIGALLGTLMVGNVWMRIIPFQRRMVEATKAGQIADFSLGEQAKTRSVHNNYMTLPVIFIMISHHFPMTYTGSFPWLVLIFLFLAGMTVRYVINTASSYWHPLTLIAIVGLTAAIVLSLPQQNISSTSHEPALPQQEPVAFNRVNAIITSRCLSCHSQSPSDLTFGPMPAGVAFDRPDQIQRMAERIKVRAVVTKTMPILNKTGMNDEERQILGYWIEQGAKLE